MNAANLKTPIYLDNNASTPVDARVVECMTRVLRDDYGNPSNKMHCFGRQAAELVDEAREQVAWLIGANASEIIFTSSATESCNLAIKGVARKYARQGNHIVTCASEHKAVLNSVRRLESNGFDVTWLRPDRYGRVSAKQVDEAVGPETILVSIMAANNVVGTLNPIAEIGQVAKRREVLFHCDATQAVGKIPIDVKTIGVDLLSLSAHKFHGPKGVGALYLRGESPKVRLTAQTDGGGHEGGLRAGTLNVPAIAGMGVACELAREELDEVAQRIESYRDRLWNGLVRRLPGVAMNCHPTDRLPTTLNVTFEGVAATDLMQAVPEIAASVGSACTSGTDDPHYVLGAMGFGEDRAAGSVRFSLGRFTTAEEIDFCIEKLTAAVTRLQSHGSSGATACPAGCCENPDECGPVQVEWSSGSKPSPNQAASPSRKGTPHDIH